MQDDDGSNTKVVSLTGKPLTNQSNLEANLKLLKDNLESLLEYHSLTAQIQSSRFKEYLKLGFTREEALALIK